MSGSERGKTNAVLFIDRVTVTTLLLIIFPYQRVRTRFIPLALRRTSITERRLVNNAFLTGGVLGIFKYFSAEKKLCEIPYTLG